MSFTIFLEYSDFWAEFHSVFNVIFSLYMLLYFYVQIKIKKFHKESKVARLNLVHLLFHFYIFSLNVTNTIFLEYECHKESKVAGLNCLRNQLTGDELLVWTIETFNMFYKKV